MNELYEHIVEAEEKNYAGRDEFNKEQNAFIDALLNVQTQINIIEKQLEPLLAQKKLITPNVLAAIKEIQADGVRVDKILMYIRKGGPKNPSYADVLKKAKAEMSKQFVTKLEQLGNELSTMTEDALVVKTNEASIPSKIKSLFTSIINTAKELGSSLTNIEGMLGMKNTSEKRINENADSNYKEKVETRVHIDGFKSDGDQFIGDVGKIELTYNIEIEMRSWGINGIDMRPISMPEFELPIMEYGDVDDKQVETIPIKVDFNKVDWKVSWYRGKVYVPDAIDIYLTADKKVKKVEIDCFFVDQNE